MFIYLSALCTRLCLDLFCFDTLDPVWIVLVDGFLFDMFYYIPVWTAEEVSLSDLCFMSVVE